MTVRMFEIDAQGHLAGSAYVDYASQALWETLRSAGIDIDAVLASGVGPVILETSIRYRRELRSGDAVAIDCGLSFGDGKTYRVDCSFLRGDGEVAAEVANACGLLDLDKRALIAEPAACWRRFAAQPERIGL